MIHSNAHMNISASTLEDNGKGYRLLLLVAVVAGGQRVLDAG